MPREFRLKNAIGQEFDLMRKDAFFHAPDGLGMGITVTSSDLGDFYLKTDSKIDQKNITGEMIFADYSQFDEFAKFASYPPLTMQRRATKETEWESLSCEVSKLNLSEIQPTSRRLICAVDFICYSPWKAKTRYEISVTPPSENDYPHSYPHGYYSAASGSVSITNSGVYDAPLKITIDGACVNPHYSLRQNNTEIGQGTINVSVNAGDMLVINSNPEEAEICIYGEDGQKTDVYQNSDFSTERFIYAPPGDSTLVCSHTGDDVLKIAVEVYPIVR